MDYHAIDADTVVTIAFTFAFGLWAAVVGVGVRKLVSELTAIRREFKDEMQAIGNDLKQESSKLNQYVVQTESRLAILEDRVINHGKN